MKKSKFSEEQIAIALRQVDAGAPIPEVTRRLGISEATYYVWRKRYGQMAVVEIRRLRQRLDLKQHVKLGNPIPQEEVAKELVACHVFVIPCRKDPKTGNIDGIPTVFMEAMATGRPVISCPISGIPELVRHGETGLLVHPMIMLLWLERLLAWRSMIHYGFTSEDKRVPLPNNSTISV
jgi:glycosyltransferase involved in cell wall biosynthesis